MNGPNSLTLERLMTVGAPMTGLEYVSSGCESLIGSSTSRVGCLLPLDNDEAQQPFPRRRLNRLPQAPSPADAPTPPHSS